MRYLSSAALLLGLLLGSAQALAGAERDFAKAAELDDASTVKRLLGQGSSPNTIDPVSQEPVLLLALREGSSRVIDALLAAPGLDLEQQAPNGNTALMMAAFKRNRAAVDALLARGARVNRSGWTPLHYAAAGGDPGITRLLIEQGAELNPRAVAGITPLMMAAREGQEEAVRVLLAAGADPALRDSEGSDALRLAERADKPRIAALIAPYLKRRNDGKNP